MQEEVNQKIISISWRGTQLTAKTLARILRKMINLSSKGLKGVYENVSSNEMSMKEFMKSGDSASKIEVTGSMKDFEKEAKRYGIHYAAFKDKATDPPTYTVFFKAKDTEVMQSAFKDYVKRNEKRHVRKPEHAIPGRQRVSVKEQLAKKKLVVEQMKKKMDKVRNMTRGVER